jgi:hypothetical protein
MRAQVVHQAGGTVVEQVRIINREHRPIAQPVGYPGKQPDLVNPPVRPRRQ